MKFYTGIGSRTTPTHILQEMREMASELAAKGWTLRSGGAKGADTAFEEGCDVVNGEKEIYLPWKNFNNNPSPYFSPPLGAYSMAMKYHPNPTSFDHRPSIGKLMARNSCQLFGYDLYDISFIKDETYSSFVICWTQDGVEKGEETTARTGGTGQVIRIASAYYIPVFNLKNDDAVDRLHERLKIYR